MARLIDADRVLEIVRGQGIEHPNAYHLTNYATLILREAPTVDAVPVARCKDCKWFANNNGGEWFGCWLFNAIRAVPEDAPTPDDFCSKGERKGRDYGHTM